MRKARKPRQSIVQFLISALLLLIILFTAVPRQAFSAIISEGKNAIPLSGIALDGEKIDIEPLIGKQVIILKFGSIYCSTCVQSIAALSGLQQKYSTSVVKIVGLNLDIYGTFRVKRFYRGYKDLVKYPVMVDRNLEISSKYGVTSLPALVVIGKDGKVAKVMKGYEEEELEWLHKYIEALVSETPVTKLAGIGEEDEFEIHFPTNFTKTFQDSIYVIGRTPERGAKLTLSLNGGSRQEIVSERKMFYFRTPVSLGSNYIEVSRTGPDGKQTSRAIVLFREPKMGRGFEGEFPVYKFHLRENEARCKKCHEVEPPRTTDRNFMMITRMCMDCHKELAEKNYVHGPIPVGGCAPCHDFGSLPARYELLSTGSDLCYSCHQEKQDEFAKSYIHGPLAAGFCSICHSPHGSNEKYNLRLPQGQMCTVCHQKIKDQTVQFNLHRPFDEGTCTECHDPHASNNANLFLKGVEDDLCYRCHGDVFNEGHRHPVGVVPNTTFPGMKLTEFGELVCLSCHNPHGSDSEALLPSKGCSACHSY